MIIYIHNYTSTYICTHLNQQQWAVFFSFHDLGSLYSEFARNERNHSRRALACATLPRCGPVRWNSLGETNSLDVFGEGESSRLLFPLD